LLSAIENFKEYKNILLGYHYSIIVFTDHENNSFNDLKDSDQVLHTCCLLLLEEYGVAFEYLPGKVQKNVGTVVDALSRLDIDSLKIQEEKEEVLTLLLGSENNNISNIKLTILMHTALIFKEQAKIKDPGLREKGLDQPQYSIQHIEGYDILCYKDNKQNIHSSIIEIKNNEYCSGTMNIYFIRDRLEQKRLSEISRHVLVLHKMLNIDCLCFACQVCQMTN
jgi:hypothetical protein